MGGAISTVVLVAGLFVMLAAGPRVAGVDSMLAGLVMVIVGAIGALVTFLLWSTGPRPSRRERRDGEGEGAVGGPRRLSKR